MLPRSQTHRVCLAACASVAALLSVGAVPLTAAEVTLTVSKAPRQPFSRRAPARAYVASWLEPLPKAVTPHPLGDLVRETLGETNPASRGFAASRVTGVLDEETLRIPDARTALPLDLTLGAFARAAERGETLLSAGW